MSQWANHVDNGWESSTMQVAGDVPYIASPQFNAPVER